jgi:lipid-A-disaccharide synthase
MKPLNILIIAGEVSGDMHAAGLVQALRQRMPDAAFFGIGGDHLREAGVEIHYDVKDMAVMGFWEILHRLAFFRRVFHRMLDLARERKPDAVILVDYPGFNLRFAERVHEMGIKVIYYVCPQVWAWHRSRIDRKSTRLNSSHDV